MTPSVARSHPPGRRLSRGGQDRVASRNSMYMRRVYLFLFISLLSAESALSQVRLGVTGGWDLIDASLDGDVRDKLSASNTNGFSVGPMLEVKGFVLPVGLDVSVLYSKKDITLNEQTEKARFIVVPLNAKFIIGALGVFGVYFATGPQWSFELGNDDLFSQLEDWERSRALFKLTESQFSWNFGAGFRLLRHFQVGYTYNIGLGRIGEFNYFDAWHKVITGELNSKYHQISVAYLF